jgi:hypothetical protein
VTAARPQGWDVQPYNDGTKFVPADKTQHIVRVHRTPSDHRWQQNKDKDFRRSGLIF